MVLGVLVVLGVLLMLLVLLVLLVRRWTTAEVDWKNRC
jgi:hypothetical protein